MEKGDLVKLAVAIVWSFSTIVTGSTSDRKEKLPVRLLTTLTVLFLIVAGSPLADISANTANAETNPYMPTVSTVSTGTIIVNTNNAAAAFNITGPVTYSGSGTSWSQSGAPEGTYYITFNPISGNDTPAGDTQILVGGDNITFTGLYN